MRHGPLGPMHVRDGWDGMARWDRRMHAAWLSAEVGAWWCTGWHRARRTRHGIMPSAWGVMPRARSRVGTRGAAPQVPVWRVGRTPTLTHASIGETMQVPTFPALPCGGSADETMLPIRSSGGAGHAPGVRNLAVRIICAGGHASALISRPRYVIIDPRPDLYQLVKLYWTSPIRLRSTFALSNSKRYRICHERISRSWGVVRDPRTASPRLAHPGDRDLALQASPPLASGSAAVTLVFTAGAVGLSWSGSGVIVDDADAHRRGRHPSAPVTRPQISHLRVARAVPAPCRDESDPIVPRLFPAATTDPRSRGRDPPRPGPRGR